MSVTGLTISHSAKFQNSNVGHERVEWQKVKNLKVKDVWLTAKLWKLTDTHVSIVKFSVCRISQVFNVAF